MTASWRNVVPYGPWCQLSRERLSTEACHSVVVHAIKLLCEAERRITIETRKMRLWRKKLIPFAKTKQMKNRTKQ